MKVVIFRGEGRSFSSGYDVNELGTQYWESGEDTKSRPSQRRRLLVDAEGRNVLRAIFQSRKVVIGELKGYVLGGAFEFVLGCDILIAAEGTIIGSPPARMVAAAGMSSSFSILRLGPALYAEMMLLGRFISAEEGYERPRQPRRAARAARGDDAGGGGPREPDPRRRHRDPPMAASFTLASQLPPEEPGARVYSTVTLACRGAESWLMVCYRDAGEWAQLCAVLGLDEPPEPPADPAATPAAVVEAAASADRHEVASALQAAGVAAAPVQTARDLFLDPHFEERDVFALCHHSDPEVGARPFGHAFPVRVLGARHGELRDPPRDLGRDNRTVFREVLGYSDERIDELYAAGIAGEEPSTRFGRAWATRLDTAAMIHDGGALPAPDYLELLSERFGERVGPTRWPEEGA